MIATARIDKWLWSVRIYKTRTKATDACKAGHVFVCGKKVKPSFQLSIGESVMIKKNGFNFDYEVEKLIIKRVGAPLAQLCYVDKTPDSELMKYKLWFTAAGAKSEFREKGEGRPTKKNRREIDRFKIEE